MAVEASGGLRIRPGTAEDAPAIGSIDHESTIFTYTGIMPEATLADSSVESATERWAQAIANRDPEAPSRLWLAERAGEVVGYATTSPATDRWLDPPEGAGELTNLYLAPAVIGSGVGSALYDHAINDLIVRGFDPIVIWAFRDNDRGRGFYERHGLTVDAETDWVLSDIPCPIVRYRLDVLMPT